VDRRGLGLDAMSRKRDVERNLSGHWWPEEKIGWKPKARAKIGLGKLFQEVGDGKVNGIGRKRRSNHQGKL